MRVCVVLLWVWVGVGEWMSVSVWGVGGGLGVGVGVWVAGCACHCSWVCGLMGRSSWCYACSMSPYLSVSSPFCLSFPFSLSPYCLPVSWSTGRKTPSYLLTP